MARLPLLALLLLPLAVRAADPEAKLGEAYQAAAPGEKLVLLAEAEVDKTLTHAEVVAAGERALRAALSGVEGAEARLQLLGTVRGQARDKHKALGEERKTAGKPPVPGHLIEPDSMTQEALAVEHVAAAAGVDPTPEKLVALELVRTCAQLPVASRLTYYYLEQALRRDEAFQGADAAGREKRLGALPEQALPYGMRGGVAQVLKQNDGLEGQAGYHGADVEAKLKHLKAIPQKDLPQRQPIVDGLLLDWFSSRLAAGEDPAALAGKLEKWRKAGTITTPPYVERLAQRVAELRGKGKKKK